MSSIDLRARLTAGETLFTAWSAIPDPLVSEFLARSDFDAVTLDMQHGCHSTDSVMRGVSAISMVGKPAIVRVPVGSFEIASRVLDFGAIAVIAPMVNSAADAKAFASFMKYPPIGERSWGTTRILPLQGRASPQSYLEIANREVFAIAMIETRAAWAALDEILAVDGIDGVFVGPQDFSIALSNGAKVDPNSAEMLAAAAEVVAKANKAGKVPCTLGVNPEGAKRWKEMGFRLIAISSDLNYLSSGANAMVATAKGAG